MSDVSHDSSVYEQWRQQLVDRGIPLLAVQHPLRVEFGDGSAMEVLPSDTIHFDNLDETSLVAHLSWQNASFLFSGDLEADRVLEFGDAGWPLACAVLKVPHHGSDGAVNDDLLAVAGPDLAIISVGADNRFGHPAEGTLACLEHAGVKTLRTDQAGTVEVTTDGERYWLQAAGSP